MAATVSKLKAAKRPKRGFKSVRRRNVASTSLQRDGTVSQWGNSLGFRIPKEAADRLGLSPGAQVTIEVADDSITIRPARPRRRKWRLADLLKGVTPAKVGGEWDAGAPVGREIL